MTAPTKRAALYVRVSTSRQHTENQYPLLKAAAGARGWQIVHAYEETDTSYNMNRQQRAQLLQDAARGRFDVVLCWSLDRWGRSLADILLTIDRLWQLGVAFATRSGEIDSTSAQARFSMQVMGSFAELERALGRERQAEGIARRKAEGLPMGRKAVEIDEVRLCDLFDQGYSQRQVAAEMGISRAMVRRRLEKLGRNSPPNEGDNQTPGNGVGRKPYLSAQPDEASLHRDGGESE